MAPLLVDSDPRRALGEEVSDNDSFLIDEGRKYLLVDPKPVADVGVVRAFADHASMMLGLKDLTGTRVAMECIVPLHDRTVSVIGKLNALGLLRWSERLYPCVPAGGLSSAAWHFIADEASMTEAIGILRNIAEKGKVVGSMIVLGTAERAGLPGLRQHVIRAERIVPVGRGVNWKRYLADAGHTMMQTADIISKLQNAGRILRG
ncbi:MAG: hypothetical protein JSR60_04125 [Proteobacteria bacterium]|nr:hypothetical protein [Pseudomonadota bacterium]